MDYPWITEAKKQLGLDENKHATTIKRWVQDLGVSWFTKTFRANSVPWCGVLTAHCIKQAKLELPKLWMRASEWSTWGIGLSNPTAGCIVTFIRQGGGHVGFVLGETEDGKLVVLGGNQRNQVNVMKFEKDRVSTYRWPKGYPLPERFSMPTMTVAGAVSTNEA